MCLPADPRLPPRRTQVCDMETIRFYTLAKLLALVVLSSLFLLPFGLSPEKSPFEFLHYPTVAFQSLFIFAVLMRQDCRASLSTLTSLQRLSLAALFIYIAGVSFFSPIPAAFFLAQFWLIHVAFFVALVCFYRTATAIDQNQIWLTLGVAGLVHVAAFLFAWAIWPELILSSVFPVFENIRFLGYFVAPASVAMAFWFVLNRDCASLAFICFLAASFYCIYTGSRGGAAGTTVGMMAGAIYIYAFKLRIDTRRALILVLATVVLFVLAALLPQLPWPPLLGRAVQEQSATQLLSARDILWVHVARVIEDRWLWGYGPAFVNHVLQIVLGPANFDELLINTRNTHNIVLQLLINWGVVGTVIFATTILSFASSIWKALKTRPASSVFSLVVLVTMSVHSLVSGVFFYPYSTILGIIAFAALTCFSTVGIRSAK